MKEIGGKVAVVTGASRGLGRYVAEALFDHGVKLLITARSADELEAVRSSFDRKGTRSFALAGDITDEAHRARVIGEAVSRFGSLDILVNNAGTDDPKQITDVSLDEVKGMFDLNVIALVDMTLKAIPVMLGQGSGHVCNMASAAGLAPVPYATIYSATKHAIVGFSSSLRYELQDRGVEVSTVCPYFVSEAGLFHDNTGGDTSVVPTVTPSDVADGVIKAIIGNRDRVVVSPPFMKLTPLGNGISPRLVATLGKMTGSYDAMRQVAQRKHDEQERRASPAAGAPTGARTRKKPQA